MNVIDEKDAPLGPVPKEVIREDLEIDRRGREAYLRLARAIPDERKREIAADLMWKAFARDAVTIADIPECLDGPECELFLALFGMYMRSLPGDLPYSEDKLAEYFSALLCEERDPQ